MSLRKKKVTRMIVALMKEVEFLVEAPAGCETEGEIKREITFNFSISVSFSEKKLIGTRHMHLH